MTDKKNIRIFCPTHEAVFETAENPKILCEITEHALSVGFPHSEFWEFCSNCETFSPSRLDKSEKARKNCYGCGNEISKRYVCRSCEVVSFECSAQTKGKSYFISANGIEPECPGCHTSLPGEKTFFHQCESIDADIFTTRQNCPFCLEKTEEPGTAVHSGSSDGALECPQCHAANLPNALFCGKCRYQFRNDINVFNPGSEVNRTQLLGSLCPNCSTPIPADSDFCGECGQAVKKAAPPPAPPPPPAKPTPSMTTPDFDITPPTVSAPDNSGRNIILGLGGVFVLIVIGAIAFGVSKSSSSSTSSSNMSPSQIENGNSRAANSARASYASNMSNAAANAANTERSFSVVGKYGYITLNVNMRNGPDRRYNDIGTLYQDTKVKILQVAKREDSSDWWQVEVETPSDYGCSSVDSSRCGQDDPGDATQGWINSKFVVFR